MEEAPGGSLKRSLRMADGHVRCRNGLRRDKKGVASGVILLYTHPL